jgi:hypothetical protein
VSGFSLLEGGRTRSVDRWPYSFGDRYVYDNTGSRWNYDNSYHDHHRGRRPKYWQPRFEYDDKTLNENEQLQDLVEHLSRQYHYHPGRSLHGPNCR